MKPEGFRLLFAHSKLSFGGGERVLIEQIAALSQLPVEVSLLFLKDPSQRDIEPEIRRRNPNVKAVAHLGSVLGYAAWLLRHRPDAIVECGNPKFCKALRLLRLLGIRFPLMVTAHEHYARHFRRYRSISGLVDTWLLTYDFRDAVRARVGDKRFHIVHPLYPRKERANWSAELRVEARKGLGLPEEALVVGYIGRQDTNKEPWSVLRLAELLQESLDRPVWVLLAGQESPRVTATLDARIQASPLRERVRRLPKAPNNGPAFAALDLFVLASYQEGFFPLSLIEAMERGVPVAATTVGGIPTVLKEGEGAFLIRKEDDRNPVSEEALGEAATRIAPALGSPVAWQAQREAAAALVHRVRDGYDAAALYREAFSELLGLDPSRS